MGRKRKRSKSRRGRERSSSLSSVDNDDEISSITTAPEAKSKTPNLDKVMKYAQDNKKGKLLKALKKMYSFVGADDLKESFARSIQYYIVSNVKTQVRRSKRKRYTVRRAAVPKEEESEEDDSDDNLLETDLEGGNVKDVLFSLILAEKIKTILGRDDEQSDEEESDGENVRAHEGSERELKKLHTCLLGAPGTGKTTFAEIIVDVWDALKIIDKKKFFITGRGDWVAKYHGHSAQKAKKLIRKAKGGVIFIDEAYALISSSSDDMFGSEVLTTIVEAMTSPEKDVVFIMAGYKDKMERLFKNNSGLERRFSYIYEIQKPSVDNVIKIFQNQVRKLKWKLRLSDDELKQFFVQHSRLFEFAGGSTEKFLDYCRHESATRSFPNPTDKTIILSDLKHAVVTMKSTDIKMKNMAQPPPNMYI